MRHVVLALALLLTSAVAAAPQSAAGDRLVGSWAGTYAGDVTGRYTMSFARDGSGQVTGTLEVVPDGGMGYTATFKTIAVEDDSVTLAYDAPDAPGVEVELAGTLQGTTLEGTWKVEDAGATTSSGTFSGSKK